MTYLCRQDPIGAAPKKKESQPPTMERYCICDQIYRLGLRAKIGFWHRPPFAIFFARHQPFPASIYVYIIAVFFFCHLCTPQVAHTFWWVLAVKISSLRRLLFTSTKSFLNRSLTPFSRLRSSFRVVKKNDTNLCRFPWRASQNSNFDIRQTVESVDVHTVVEIGIRLAFFVKNAKASLSTWYG